MISPPGRIRRSNNVPQGMQQIFDILCRPGSNLPRRLMKIPGREDLSVTTQTWKQDTGFDDGDIGLKKFRAAITMGGTPVAGMVFSEYAIQTHITESGLFFFLDSLSHLSGAFAQIILDNWCFDDLMDICTPEIRIVAFDELWVANEARAHGVWIPVAQHIIRKRYQGKCDMLFLKPFPTEFEGILGEEDHYAQAQFSRRRSAMMKLYSRAMSVQPIRMRNSDECWMYSPMREDIPEPALRAS